MKNCVICKGSFMGSEIENGVFHGGELEGGTFHGGELEGGTFHEELPIGITNPVIDLGNSTPGEDQQLDSDATADACIC